MKNDFVDINIEEPSAANEQMKEGLARAYADIGFRTYLENVIKINNHNALVYIEKGQNDKALQCTIKIKVLKDLLSKGRLLYTNFEGIKNATQKRKEQENNIEEHI